jgi:DNA modification methylase
MRYIHPFPARMAPEIVLKRLSGLKKGQNVLDPMSGSGMVLNTASRLGLKPFGIDMDPLAVLISKTSSTKVNADQSRLILTNLIEKARAKEFKIVKLPWIDNNDETLHFINYWFDIKQINQLRALSYYLIERPICHNKPILNILKISLSRLIITKEPKASLARDTAHSRPHRTITNNDYDIFESLPKSLEYVLKVLNQNDIVCNSKVSIGDARKLNSFSNDQFDVIITSPPYLNAIDYMRGHKFSLVWFGYSIFDLKKISSDTIGTEKKISSDLQEKYLEILAQNEIYCLNKPLVQRYFIDLQKHLDESYRVLKPGRDAFYIVGNSNIKGSIIYNNVLLKEAAKIAGYKILAEEVRKIPSNRRYMPINATNNQISNRIKNEYIISLKKPK